MKKRLTKREAWERGDELHIAFPGAGSATVFPDGTFYVNETRQVTCNGDGRGFWDDPDGATGWATGVFEDCL